MFSRLIKTVSLIVVVGVVTFTIGVFAFNNWTQTPLLIDKEIIVKIQSGDTLGKISYQLANDNIVSQPKWLILYAKLTERTRVEVGEYRVAPGTTPEQLLDVFQSGDVITYSVTLVEGKAFRDFLNVLHAQEDIEVTLKGKTPEEIIALNQFDIKHPEGWFYPDTYQYVSGTTDNDILIKAHQRMKKVLAEEWKKKSEGLPYKNAYEALIMASIIEKETGFAYERPEIAGVFVRRLQKGMRLQTDPTIIYGLGDSYQGNIRRKHLSQPTPYNTYIIPALPPTPIAMPGREAIHAALHPADGKNLFFVAKGDGSHQFSETLAQHNKAVREYQIKNRAKKYRSAPSAQ